MASGGGPGAQTEVDDLKSTARALTDLIEALKAEVTGLKTDKKQSDLPFIHQKDVEKPFKFHGDKWMTWEQEFVGFLSRRDRRWRAVLNTIKTKSDKPLTKDTLALIRAHKDIRDFMNQDLVYQTFQDQLYDYLKSYTTGDVYTMVVANGDEKSFGSWRRLCDQGRSRRMRPMRDGKRALYHPKQATAETLIKAIAEWEKRFAAS